MAEGPNRAGLIAAFAAIYLCWGATFLAIRYAVAELPPLLTDWLLACLVARCSDLKQEQRVLAWPERSA